MEDYQLVFLTWLAKFAAFCVVALFVLNIIDRRWRAARAQKTSTDTHPTLGMSRRRTSA